jgi:hypothetical protein
LTIVQQGIGNDPQLRKLPNSSRDGIGPDAANVPRRSIDLARSGERSRRRDGKIEPWPGRQPPSGPFRFSETRHLHCRFILQTANNSDLPIRRKRFN